MSRNPSLDARLINMTLRSESSSASSGPSLKEKPLVDWKETRTEIVIIADVPGLRSEEITVEDEDARVMYLRGERTNRDNNGMPSAAKDMWHHKERAIGKFTRKFELPVNVDIEGVRANMEDGVLTITLPKEVRKNNTSLIPISYCSSN